MTLRESSAESSIPAGIPASGRRNGVLSLFAAFALFTALYGFRTATWEYLHDEGVTFNQAVGVIDFPAAPRVSGSPDTLDHTFGHREQVTLSWDEVGLMLRGRPEYGARDVIHALGTRGMHPPAYLLVFHFWARWFGASPPVIFVPGLIFGMLAVAGLYALALQLFHDRAAASWAAVMLAASAIHLHHAVYLRPYGLDLALTVWSTWLILRMHHTAPTDRMLSRIAGWIAFTALSLAGLYTLYHHAFTLLWQFVLLLLLALAGQQGNITASVVSKGTHNEKLKSVAWITSAGIAIVIGYAPWLSHLKIHLSDTGSILYYFDGFIPLIRWPQKIAATVCDFVFTRALPPAAAILYLLFVVVTLALFVRWLVLLRSRLSFSGQGGETQRTRLIFWISLPVLPLAVTAADVWHGTHTLFIIKTVIVLLPLAVLALVRAWTSLYVPAAVGSRNTGGSSMTGRPRYPAVARAGLWLWFVMLLIPSLLDIHQGMTHKSDIKQVAEYALRHEQAAHTLVLSTALRGYAQPLLRTCRDRGVGTPKVAAAGRGELLPMLDAIIDDDDTVLVSLVDLELRSHSGWSADELAAAKDLAQRRGWRVEETGTAGLADFEPAGPNPATAPRKTAQPGTGPHGQTRFEGSTDERETSSTPKPPTLVIIRTVRVAFS